MLQLYNMSGEIQGRLGFILFTTFLSFTISIQHRYVSEVCSPYKYRDENCSILCHTRVSLQLDASCDGWVHEAHNFWYTKNENFIRNIPLFHTSQYVTDVSIFQNGSKVSSPVAPQVVPKGMTLTISLTNTKMPITYDLIYKITNIGLRYKKPCPGDNDSIQNSNIIRWGSGFFNYLLPSFSFSLKTAEMSSSFSYNGTGKLRNNSGSEIQVSRYNVSMVFEEVFWEKSGNVCPTSYKCPQAKRQWQFRLLISLAIIFAASLLTIFLCTFVKDKLVCRWLIHQHSSRYEDSHFCDRH